MSRSEKAGMFTLLFIFGLAIFLVITYTVWGSESADRVSQYSKESYNNATSSVMTYLDDSDTDANSTQKVVEANVTTPDNMRPEVIFIQKTK
jgi:hypothetical protein